MGFAALGRIDATRWVAGFALCAALGLPVAAHAKFISCTFKYESDEWSFFYKSVIGKGTVRCSDGTSSPMAVRMHGGGLTLGVGRLKVSGAFTEVRELREVFGTYGAVGGHGGIVAAGGGRVGTKGSVWTSHGGSGSGFNLGIAAGAISFSAAEVSAATPDVAAPEGDVRAPDAPAPGEDGEAGGR